MKKLFLFFGCIVVLLLLVIMFLFSSSGNEMIKPYVEKIIKEKSGYDVKFQTFRVGFNHLNLKSNVNNEIFLDLNGPYSIFSKSFDIDYKINIENLKSFGFEINEKMNLVGKINGNMSDFNANATGKFLDSDIKLIANIKEMKPNTLKIDANGLNLSKALPLAKLPLYAFGSVDINANIQNSQGNAIISTKELTLNEKTFKDELNITLPKNTTLSAVSELNIKDENINAKTYINSNLKTEISAKNTAINLNTKQIDSDFNIKLNDLSRLEPFTKQKLIGALDINGDLSIKKYKLDFLNARITGLDGDIVANLKGESLKAKLNNVSLSKILKMLNQPNFSTGKINADIISTINFKDVTAKANIQEAFLNKNELDKISGKNFPENLNYTFEANLEKKEDNINAKANFNSKIAKFDLKNITIKNGDISSNYILDIFNLSDLSFLTDTKLNGQFLANGSTNLQNGKFLTSITSNFLDGNLKADIKNDNFNKTGFNALMLNSTFENFNVKKLTDMLNYSHIYDGIGNADFDYDLAKKYGKFSLDINKGMIAKSGFTDILKLLTQGSFDAAVFDKADVNGTIKNNIINFDSWVGNSSKKSKSAFNVKNGNIDLITSKIYIPIRGNVEKTDILVDITGTTKEPKYNVNSKYLKSKISEQINKGLDKILKSNTKENTNNSPKDTAKDALKDVLKGLF